MLCPRQVIDEGGSDRMLIDLVADLGWVVCMGENIRIRVELRKRFQNPLGSTHIEQDEMYDSYFHLYVPLNPSHVWGTSRPEGSIPLDRLGWRPPKMTIIVLSRI